MNPLNLKMKKLERFLTSLIIDRIDTFIEIWGLIFVATVEITFALMCVLVPLYFIAKMTNQLP
jgi:multidrug efflux pump subunit AcrB